jgi:propanol-preferring alcohol dehydrogenase
VADLVLDARQGDVRDRIWAHLGDGVHVTINLAEPQPAVTLACQITRTHGTLVQVVQVGFCSTPDIAVMEANTVWSIAGKSGIPFKELTFRDIQVIGTKNTSNQKMQDMLDVVATAISVRTELFHGLAEIPTLLEAVEAGKVSGKAVVVVDQEQVG